MYRNLFVFYTLYNNELSERESKKIPIPFKIAPNFWQKPIQYYKVIIFQLKIKIKKLNSIKKNKISRNKLNHGGEQFIL